MSTLFTKCEHKESQVVHAAADIYTLHCSGLSALKTAVASVCDTWNGRPSFV